MCSTRHTWFSCHIPHGVVQAHPSSAKWFYLQTIYSTWTTSVTYHHKPHVVDVKYTWLNGKMLENEKWKLKPPRAIFRYHRSPVENFKHNLKLKSSWTGHMYHKPLQVHLAWDAGGWKVKIERSRGNIQVPQITCGKLQVHFVDNSKLKLKIERSLGKPESATDHIENWKLKI